MLINTEKRYAPYSSIGGAIKHYRLKNKLTQNQLAKKLEICQGTVSLYEQDKITPPVYMIQKLSLQLGCPITLLIGQRTTFLG